MISGLKKRLMGLVKPQLVPWLISALVLLFGFIVSTTLWRNAQQHQLEKIQTELEFSADQAANNILRRLDSYEMVMRGVKGYMDGSIDVTIEEFRAYIQALQIEEKKSGVQGIGLVMLVSDSEKKSHIAESRKLGLTDYKIKPDGERDNYAPIVRMEPMNGDNLKALGLDVLTVPAARAAIERSRDLDEVSITSHFTLVQDIGKPNTFSFVMYLPIFQQGMQHDTIVARRSAIKGWVDVPFRMNDLMAGLYGEFAKDIDIEIHDGLVVNNGNAPSDQSLMFRSDNKSSKSRLAEGVLQTKRQLDFGGRSWTLLVNTTPAFEARVSDPQQPAIVAWAGTALTLTLAILAWLLARGRQIAKVRYQQLFEQAGEGVLMLSREHRLIEANPAALALFGYTREELLKLNLPSLLAKNEVARLNPVVESMMAGTPHSGEWMHVRKDGTEVMLEVHARRLDGNSYFAILRDLTERNKAEQSIQRLKNLYRALSEINQAIVRMANEADLFPLVCRCAVKFGGMKMAWIGQADESGTFILPVASYGNGLTYLEGLKISTSADVPEGCGPTGITFHENRAIIISNFQENEITRPWHEQAKRYGWGASGSFPITRNGKPFAVFSIYDNHIDAFDKEMIDLLREMAMDISFALDNFEREKQRQLSQNKLLLAQAAVEESRDRYADLYEFAPVGYLSISKQGLIAEVNWKVTSMFGLKRNQLNDHPFMQFVDNEEKQCWQQLFLSMLDLDGGEELNFDMKFTHENGNKLTANLNCLRMDDEGEQPILRVAMIDVTQLKQAEEARQQTDLRLQATIDAIPDLMFEVDLNGRYYAVHSTSNQLLVLPPEELIGKTVHEVLPPEAASIAMSAINEADEDGRSQGRQYELQLPQGKRWFELSISKKSGNNHDDNPHFIVLSRDITERKQVEAALQSSELHLRTIIDVEPECIKIVDAQGCLKEMNPAGLAMLEADNLDQISNKPLLDFIAPKYHKAFKDLHKHVIAGETKQLEFEVIGLRGGRRWLETHAVPMLDKGQKVLLGVTRDITERKLAELEVRISATAFESQEGMMVTDANKTILKVNKAFTKISGYSAEEAVGQTPRLVSSGHHHADFYELMWDKIAINGGWEGEVWNRRKNGEVYPQHLTITAVKDSEDAVTNYVASFTDVTLRNAAEAEINHLAFYDVLTRLPNRRLLIDRLNHALSAGARLGWGGALLFLDLDHFKTLNDTLGHDVGDLLLRQVAERLTACVREGDTVARLGGDEFVVMLEDLSKQPIEAAAQAKIIANKILTTISQPFYLSKKIYQSTASIGVVLFSDNEHSQETLLKHADIAMYQAKKAGRNTLCFFDPDMQVAINTRAALEIDLRNAIDNQQFELYYQVQVNILGQPLGAEALIRWPHPERGLVSPYNFIPLAEETGLILPIGQWVLESACAQLQAWQQAPATRNLTLSINVSPKQFYQSNFASQVKTAVKHFNVNPKQLKLELTESILLEHIDDTIMKMNELRNIGVHFSLDDFGTGYSSLQYLKLLPLYQLKIDQSFVSDIATDTSDQAIVRTIIAMAETLNLEVIAEGVESTVQRELLTSCGCDTYQGYLFGRPVPIEQFNAALKSV
ncbi:PAS domain S-box protein [Methylotenera sp.]|uniref:PAS domain S-box protein n=1 Tax=Methylotenera sp. TaxID=2051956 RepID=UPI002716A14F|nr:PAS domain S-box protein [Methylotenera sp.]MDO9204445.1 PAS domain S-box protein [Methylotenera sp.]